MSMKPGSDERLKRAEEFRRRLKATGLTITEFQRRSGLTRNVVYNLSKGQLPSSQEQADILERALRSAGSGG
jgi:predicted transcriptional regulator